MEHQEIGKAREHEGDEQPVTTESPNPVDTPSHAWIRRLFRGGRFRRIVPPGPSVRRADFGEPDLRPAHAGNPE
ncbi:hypothetical protein GCM10009654_56960 [Streptomyces hebeiensis]|uniref:Uncharacterized protein n=1 Tax=Streptomyces hebeiensis TaxID=229486 RepID=A0ABN1V3K0_9ACTN